MNNSFIYEKLKDVLMIVAKIKSELNTSNDKVSTLKENVLKIETELNILKSKDVNEDIAKLTAKLLEKTEKYYIKDGYWYYQDKKICKSVGEDGKDGKDGLNGKDGANGKDGLDGKNGINGLNGRDGKDGIDGKDGLNGKDGITPEIEDISMEIVPSYEDADIECIRNGNKYSLHFKIPKGKDGLNGRNATINGLNAMEMIAGKNITIDQYDNVLTINASGGTQTQSDLAQEDDTAVDFVKNKKGAYINGTLYIDEEPVLEADIDTILSLLLEIIMSNEENLQSEIDQKQNPLEDIPITLSYSQWSDKEIIVYVGVSLDDKIWYSPTEDSYDDFVDSEIRMIEQDNGYVKFKCETTPEEDIYVLIRRA